MLIKLLENIVKKLVEKTDYVAISETITDGKCVVRISVARSDLRRVIGSGGRVFRAFKTLISVASQMPTDLFVEGLPGVDEQVKAEPS